jgi:hypothetical protein
MHFLADKYFIGQIGVGANHNMLKILTNFIRPYQVAGQRGIRSDLMKTAHIFIFFVLSIQAAVLSGCGDNKIEIGAVSALDASESCIGCHGNSTSQVTGEAVVDEWQLSAHNTKSGASCRDCHEPEPGHPNSCGSCHGGAPAASSARHDVTLNPDTDQKCAKCHTVSTLSAPHFGNMTASTTNTRYRASYVSSQNMGNCRKCHNPHDPSSQSAVTKEWAKSGHGDTIAPPWANSDFKTRGTAGAVPADSVATACVRCHTTTGYINYVSSGFTDIHAWGDAGDKTKEVLACNACHDDGNGNAYSWKKRRTVGRVTAYSNYSSPITGKRLVSFPFPDVGTSNICVACHTGNQSGRTIKGIAPFANFSTLGFINSHYLPAAATLFKGGGFEFYSSTGKYENVATFTHGKTGVDNYSNTGNNGPCAGCHMSHPAPADKHTLLPVKKDADGKIIEIATPICGNCHAGNDALTPGKMEEENHGFLAALAALAEKLKTRGFAYQGKHPYFSNTNWQTSKSGGTKGGFGSAPEVRSGGLPAGALTLGAAFNFNLLRNEPGAYAHNRYYTRRLIHDSIDWINDGVLGNDDVEAAINALPDDAALKFNSGGSTIVFDATTRSRAIAYLLGTTSNPTGAGGSRP